MNCYLINYASEITMQRYTGATSFVKFSTILLKFSFIYLIYSLFHNEVLFFVTVKRNIFRKLTTS